MTENANMEIWLVWKDPNSRQRFVVGRLWFDSKYHFQYFSNNNQTNISNCGVNLATRYGFRKLEPFQDMNVYTSDTLFNVFNRRLPNRTRPDFSKLVEEYELNLNCTTMELLEATGGRLATDTLEFITPFTIEESGEFDIDFYIAGWRYYEGKSIIDKLIPGTQLTLDLEPENKYDPFAIKVLGPENVMLGYVPIYYSRYLDEAVKNSNYNAYVKKIGSSDNPQLRVLVNVNGLVSSLADVVKRIDQRIKSHLVSTTYL